MGRPRVHDESTRDALLEAAEELVAQGGSAALSLRRLADATGTSTRAVYSVFGNKEELFSALYRRSFRELIRRIESLPLTDDPIHDLLRAGIDGFRGYALEHPNLFRLVFERIVPSHVPSPKDAEVARQALELLRSRVRRCSQDGFAGRSVDDVATAFHSLCQGLASSEIRNGLFGADDPRALWEDVVTALLSGLGVTRSKG